MSGLYSTYVFPRLIDWAMAGENFSDLRRDLLKGLRGTVLEIGFGTGLNLIHYPETVTRLVAIDPNPGMRGRAQKQILRSPIPVELHTLDSEHLPMADHTFGSVVSTWTLCSIPNVDQALGEVFRVLNPGGELLILEHGLSADARVQKWQNRLTPFQRVLGDGCHLNRNFRGLVSNAGFEIRELETFYMKRVPKIGGYIYKGVAVKPA